MEKDFFRFISPADFTKLLQQFVAVGSERVSLWDAHERILAQDVVANEDLPSLTRSCMDGYAVRAADTFGASEANPGYLELHSSVAIDEVVSITLPAGECMGIATGGTLPPGADAVLMVEYTQLLGSTVELRKTVVPGENVMLQGEDATQWATVLKAGRRLRAQEVGLMAALGQTELLVHKRPRCGIISTGDELVPVESQPKPGQIRDVNTHTLACLIRQAGGLPTAYGLCADRLETLVETLRTSLAQDDMVLISGGSSIGTRDLTIQALESFPDCQILAHGVSISPGKPTILARIGDKPVLGLPGQVVSAQIIMLVFGQPLLLSLSGDPHAFDPSRRVVRPARLAANVSSKPGREDYVRVRLETRDGELWAVPRTGKSGLLRTMLEADALMCVDAALEGVLQGTEISVWMPA